MKAHYKNIRGHSLIEVLVAIAILLIVARFVFAAQINEWENGIWNALGLPPHLARGLAGGLFFTYLGYRAIKDRRARKGKKLQLPANKAL